MSADDFAPALDDGRSEYADSMHRSLDSALERAGEVEGDLAAWLRDWRLADCEHAEVRDGGIICCSPCLRDRILASDWLAVRDAQIAAAAEAAAGERIARAIEASPVMDRWGFIAASTIRANAAAIARSVPATEAGEER